MVFNSTLYGNSFWSLKKLLDHNFQTEKQAGVLKKKKKESLDLAEKRNLRLTCSFISDLVVSGIHVNVALFPK